MTVEEYLKTSFTDLEMEFRDGQLIERGDPDLPHSTAMGNLAFALQSAGVGRGIDFVTNEIAARALPGGGLCALPPGSAGTVSERSTTAGRRSTIRGSSVRSGSREARGLSHLGRSARLVGRSYSRRMYTCDAALNEVSTLRVPELNIELKPADVFET